MMLRLQESVNLYHVEGEALTPTRSCQHPAGQRLLSLVRVGCQTSAGPESHPEPSLNGAIPWELVDAMQGKQLETAMLIWIPQVLGWSAWSGSVVKGALTRVSVETE